LKVIDNTMSDISTAPERMTGSMRTEILATIGPASINRMPEMVRAGLSGVRINSSHGDASFHDKVIHLTRKHNPDGYVVYDIKGPKIRIGDLPAPLPLQAGMPLTLRTDLPKPEGSEFPAVKNFESGIPVTFDRLDQYVRPGHRLLVDDGYVAMEVRKVSPGSIACRVIYGDILRSRKGLNHPDTQIPFPYTMPYDVPRLAFAKRHKVDFIADSFTRDADDVHELRGRLEGTGIRIISKIENPEAVKNFHAILRATDAVMIARGDLGVEMDPWKLPELQKEMIEKCARAGKPVITATQMLESMIDNPFPSRSDVSDIANAIYDGTSVIMLSAETTIGRYPVDCVRMMGRIAGQVESTARYRRRHIRSPGLCTV